MLGECSVCERSHTKAGRLSETPGDVARQREIALKPGVDDALIFQVATSTGQRD